MRRWLIVIAAAVLAVAALIVWGLGLAGVSRATGYFSPIFAADGESLYAIRRTATASVIGPGQQFFTPPARVRLHRDRFSLLHLRVSDGRMTVVDELPASPLEGSWLTAYHGAIFGTPHAYLRRTAGRLEFEVAITRHDTPLSRTFVLKRTYDPVTNTTSGPSAWAEGHPAMAGNEPAQLHGDLEAIAVPGDELMPCAIVVVRTGAQPRPLVETSVCGRKYRSGLTAEVVTPLSRRVELERAERLRSTYAELVERGRRSGRSEIEAMLDANKEMSRLGLYPKTATLVATAADCRSASPVFRITDEQFEVGLFTDIAEAIAGPDKEVDKSMGAYMTHRDYTTSREINTFLEGGGSVFYVEARGRCWRLTVHRPR